MTDVKFSQFESGGQNQTGDITVGLRGGINTQFTSPANATLSNLASYQIAFENLGFGSGQQITLTDADFIGGFYQLNNPCPNYIFIDCGIPGNTIKLPPAEGLGSFALSEGPYITVPFAFESINVQDYSGHLITTMNQSSMINFALADKSTIQGDWNLINRVTKINNLSSVVNFVSLDSSVNIDSSGGFVDLSVAIGAGGTLQTAYDNGNGTITIDNLTNTKPFSVGNDETTPFGTYGVYVSAIRNLTTTPTEFWFQFFEANNSIPAMTQYGSIACRATELTSGSEAGFMAMGAAIPTQGVLPFLYADGKNSQSGSAYPMIIAESAPIVDASSMLDVISTTKGSRPYPSVTTTQRDAISSPAIGLTVYNTTTNTIDYYDGIAWQIGLTLDHLLAGTNITLTQNGDGTVTISSSGSGSGGNADYSGWAISSNITSNSFASANTYYPIVINSGSFSDLISSGFVNEVVSISGRNTPCFRYIDSATQYFNININLYIKGAVTGQKQYIFQLSIERSGGSIVQTGFIGTIILQDLIFPYSIPLSGIIQLNTGDRVFVSVQNITDTSSCIINYGNADIVNVDATQQLAIVWNNITGTSSSMSPNNGYVTSNAGLVTLTLPTVCNFGSSIEVVGYGAGGWQITQGSGQQCFYESASTTLGATGTILSTNSKSALTLRCTVANTTFVVESTTGGITLA